MIHLVCFQLAAHSSAHVVYFSMHVFLDSRAFGHWHRLVVGPANKVAIWGAGLPPMATWGSNRGVQRGAKRWAKRWLKPMSKKIPGAMETTQGQNKISVAFMYFCSLPSICGIDHLNMERQATKLPTNLVSRWYSCKPR